MSTMASVICPATSAAERRFARGVIVALRDSPLSSPLTSSRHKQAIGASAMTAAATTVTAAR